MKFRLNSLILFIVTVVFLFACKKERFITDTTAKLNFSNDTIYFDTVFTQIGSATQILQIYNPYKESIKISSLRLAGGNSSPFRLNVDGQAGNNFKDLIIGPKDSLWIFIQVTVNPTNINSPLVIHDSILFETNSNIQDVDLVAWGQDAIYYKADTRIKGLPPFSLIDTVPNSVTTWTKNKPIVIFDYLVVDSAQKLIIEAGARIHFYTKSSGLWVYKYGSLKVNGTKEEPVTFQGGRLEHYYSEVPGQWDRIWINEGTDSCEFNYAIIKNSYVGIQAEVLSDGFAKNKLKLNNVFIRNITGWGLLSRFYNIDAKNTIITNTGNNSLALIYGGTYQFTHCTFNNYWSYDNRKNPVLLMNNFTGAQSLPFNAKFTNCIIYGDKENEISSDFTAGADSNYVFKNCLIKSTTSYYNYSDANHFSNVILNSDPLVKNKTFDLRLTSTSPCIDKGSTDAIIISPSDYDGNTRTTPDIGAFEYSP